MTDDMFKEFWTDDDDETSPDENTDVVPDPVPPPDAGSGDDSIEAFEDWVARTEADSNPGSPTKHPIPLTREDIHNAQYLVYEFGKNVRFDHVAKHWFIWHKGRHYWREDDREAIKNMARLAAKRRAEDAWLHGDKDAMKVAMSLFSLAGLNRALDAMKFFPGIAVGDNHWDQTLDVFCCANGVIDLRTGLLRDGVPLDHITKASKVRYDMEAECPKWERFLREVFVTDELIEYVRTVVGYCMTGLTVEQVWFLLYGTGANGKSVFMAVLQAVFGLKQYYEVAAAETFMTNRWGPSGSHNVAQLRRARLVMASEVPDRSMFDGARIKSLTGSEPVTAKNLYENPSTFVPQLKLMMLVNHLPDTKDDSPGFWRRMRTIPFDVTFLGADANTNLVTELLDEAPGILNWCVDGAVTYLQSGLAPEASSAVTLRAEYQAESDPLALFVNDCVLETGNPADIVPAREMFRVYVAWAAGSSHGAMTETNFGRSPTMKALGSGKKVTEKGNVYTGVRVYEPGSHGVSGVT